MNISRGCINQQYFTKWKIHKICNTLALHKVQLPKKMCRKLIERAKTTDLRVKGPVCLLKIKTRKAPNGKSSKMWDTFEMRNHKQLIECLSPLLSLSRMSHFRFGLLFSLFLCSRLFFFRRKKEKNCLPLVFFFLFPHSSPLIFSGYLFLFGSFLTFYFLFVSFVYFYSVSLQAVLREKIKK